MPSGDYKSFARDSQYNQKMFVHGMMAAGVVGQFVRMEQCSRISRNMLDIVQNLAPVPQSDVISECMRNNG